MYRIIIRVALSVATVLRELKLDLAMVESRPYKAVPPGIESILNAS